MIQIINFFLIYAFLGWVTEVVYHAVAQGVVVNRGFMNGPVCPIYGFGMLLILYLLIPISDNLCILFLGGMLLTTAIELFGGWILEKSFHMRWWDYSKEHYNLHGYICLKFSLAWGIGVVGAIRILHPIVNDINVLILNTPLKLLLIPAIILFVIDDIATVMTVLHLKNELTTIDELSKKIRNISDNLTEVIATKALETDQKIAEERVQVRLGTAEIKDQIQAERKELERELTEAKRRIAEIRQGILKHKLFGSGRIIAAYPYAILKEQEIRLKEFFEKREIGK